jgi:phage terminase large subunit
MEVEIEVSNVFERNLEAKTSIKANQGGTSSSKTYSILQVIIFRAWSGAYKGKDLTITSPSLPHLKRGAMKDFFIILNTWNIYDIKAHNKTDNKYHLPNGNTVEFFGLEDEGKARGPRRDILYVNEANLINVNVYRQLTLRTREEVFVDYNPIDEYHWIYDEVLPHPECTYIESSYLDNPFLPQKQREEIERLKDIDENLWNVYGLGKRGQSKDVIYTNWDIVDLIPQGCEVIYGLDFGFNVPSSFLEISIKEYDIYIRELIYETGLTNADLINKISSLGINRTAEIYADAAEPDRIEEIDRAGYNVKPAMKDVKDGIDCVKRFKLHVLKDSVNVIKEIRSYKWKKDKNDRVLDEPVKYNDHSMDAKRYGIYTHMHDRATTQSVTWTFVKRR